MSGALSKVGAGEACDLLICDDFSFAKHQDQKIAACGSSYDQKWKLVLSKAVRPAAWLAKWVENALS
jgi:hypothetical protein